MGASASGFGEQATLGHLIAVENTDLGYARSGIQIDRRPHISDLTPRINSQPPAEHADS
jgi:hypothetical protein